MRIGIDARFLTHPQVGGFKSYTNNLINSLGRIDSENEYVIYIDREPIRNLFPEFDNFSFRVVSLIIPHLGMPFREQVELPRQIHEDNLDFVHFLCNTAPINVEQKYIVTLHDTIQLANTRPFSSGNISRQIKMWAINAYSKWSILQATKSACKLITVSHYEKNNIAEELGIGEEHIAVTHLAPDPIFRRECAVTRAAWQEAMGEQPSLPERFILGIGYEPRKNIPLIIKAFARIEAAHPDISLVLVVAQNTRRQEFMKLAKNLGIDGRVILLGSQPPELLVMLYNLADLFVFPSERESFGLPPLEAMACGAPVIAMQSSSLVEILDNGALLLQSGDVTSWSGAMSRMLVERELRATYIENGLKRAAQFTWERCALETLNVYQTVARGDLSLTPQPC